MFLSKSFGYALRGILYVALGRQPSDKVQLEEIARELVVPKHFLSKVMKKVVKHGILNSTKGPHGGFSLTENTLSTTLFDLILVTKADAPFGDCVLRFRKCDASLPCPLHHRIETNREDLYQIFSTTTIGDLLNADKPDFIRSISTR